MGCGKCHGWMEQRYHPQLYPPKRSSRNYIHKDEMIEKKLAYSKKTKQHREKNIEAIAYKEIEAAKPAKFAVGAPFFKSERENSSASKRTKARTGNVGSDKSCNEDERESKTGKNKVGSHIEKNISPDAHLENEMWHFSEHEGAKLETRSKSQGNSSDCAPSYSHTIKDVVFSNDNALLDKLVKYKVNEITLINADQKKIDNMSFLNSKEKEKLVNKLKEYSLKKDIGFIEYSKPLTRYFVRNQADGILQKLRNKRVNEPKILKLQSRQSTKDFSFLTEEEKEQLPKLLKKYQEEIEFGSIMHSVERFIGEPTDDHSFNHDN
jgi:hypothetical protein